MILEDGHVELAIGTLLEGGLRIVEDLARGSMSSVYLARERETGREVVVKVLGGKYATRADARPRLLAEATYTEALAGHPGVVSVLSVGMLAAEGDAPYLVLEYVDGPTLKGHIAGLRPDLAHVLTLLGDLAAIVVDIHAQGIVHRDLKPANVLVGEADGDNGEPRVQVKLTDFGLATRIESGMGSRDELRLTGHHDRPGTKHYMAPEQCVSADVDCSADIYALGVTAFELLVGEPPWGSRTEREVVIRKCDPLQPSFAISELSLGLPAVVVAAIDSALEYDPERRPTAAAFRDAMRLGVQELRARPGSGPVAAVRVVRRANTPRLAVASVEATARTAGESSTDANSSIASSSATKRRANPERRVEVTELSPRAGSIEVRDDARARSGDTEHVLAVPGGLTQVVDRVAVDRAIARAAATAADGGPLGPAIEVERETWAEQGHSRGAAAMVSPPPLVRARGLPRRAIVGAIAAALVSVAAVLGLWWVETWVTPEPQTPVKTRAAGVAVEGPTSVQSAATSPLLTGSEPQLEPLAPTEGSPMEAEHTAVLEASAPASPTKIANSPRPRPAKPSVTPAAAVPAASVPAVPMHQTAVCEEARAAVARAASSAAWDDVLAQSKQRKCWSDPAVVTRVRVRAFAVLHRYEECVREGKGVSDPKIASMVEVCRTRMETP